MFTVIVFWQKGKIKTEYEWILKNNKEDIAIIYLNEEPDIKKLKEDISIEVNTREQWRLFLIDNYGYQCIFYKHGEDLNKCHCCNGVSCRTSFCGRGRNPYAEGRMQDNQRKHRKSLVEIVTAISEIKKTDFIQPKDMFVIAVRDGDFVCRQEWRIPNQTYEYWEIAGEFPETCRYLVYDIYNLNKKACSKEEFWLYCLLSLLAKSELRIAEFSGNYMYRIDVEYSVRNYYIYLQQNCRRLEKEIQELNEREIKYEEEKRKQKGVIYPYPIILNTPRVSFEKNIGNELNQKGIDFVRNRMEKNIKKIFSETSEEYEEQWEQIRKIVSRECQEDTETYEEKREEYRIALLNNNFRLEPDSVPLNVEYTSAENMIHKINKFWIMYENVINYQGNIFYYIVNIIVLSIIGIGYWILMRGGIDIEVVLKIVGGNILVHILYDIFCSKLLMFLAIADIQQNIIWVDQYQDKLENKRKDFLKSTRDVMIYWKKYNNRQRTKEKVIQIKKKIDKEIKLLYGLKREMDTLYGMGEEFAEKVSVEKGKTRKEVFVGTKKINTDFIFIQKIRFLKREEKRGKNT